MAEQPADDAITLTYRRSIAAIFGVPLVMAGLGGLVWFAVSPRQFTTLGQVVVVVGSVFALGCGASFLRHWFVTVTLRESGVELTGLMGRPRPELPWGSVVVSAKVITAAHVRLVLICDGQGRGRRQQLWPEMWVGFDDAVDWMRVRPYVHGRWDASAERADWPDRRRHGR